MSSTSRSLRRHCLAVALFISLQGCSSAPIEYHTLVPLQPAQRQGGATMDIRVDRVMVPPQVDRTQIVVRQGSSGLAILETQWWGANLTDEFHNALVNRLPRPGTAGAGGTALHLYVDVRRFESVPGQYAQTDARWRLRSRDGEVRLGCYSSLSTPAGNTVDELVTAHQANIAQLASQIETAARSGRCP